METPSAPLTYMSNRMPNFSSGFYLLESSSESMKQPEKILSRACTLQRTRHRQQKRMTTFHQEDLWIRHYAITCLVVKPKSRKVSELMVKDRGASLTYRAALTRFGREPRMETLPAVRAALKELYILKHTLKCLVILIW